jgi:hypothetical protein
MKPITITAVCLLALSALWAVAQTQKDPAAPTLDQVMNVPPTLAGQSQPLKVGNELGRESSLSGGISFTTMYTDNLFLTATGHRSEISYEVGPHIAWRQFTPRLSLELDGGAGFIANQHFNERNMASENANFELSYRLRPHLTLRASDGFANISGLFSGVGTATSQTGVGVVQQANSTVITPASHILTNTSLGELTYQFSAASNVGARGVVSILRYPDGATSVSNIPLYEEQSYSAEAFYNHRFSPRQWLGLTLRGQRFDSAKSLIVTDSGSVLLFYSLQPTSTINLTFFGGPQLISTRVDPSLLTTIGPFDAHQLLPSGGATFVWQKSRTIANLSYVRQANGGSGLGSAVTNQTMQAGLREQLTDRQDVTLAFTYATNETLVTNVKLHSYSARAEYTRRLTRSLAASLGYGWEQQNETTALLPARANRVWISLSYEMSKPLGQ